MDNLQQKLQALARETTAPCVTISLNTHRSHPENETDRITLKNMLVKVEEEVIQNYGKRPVAGLLENIASIEKEIDINHNLDSIHIFLSNTTKEYIKSIWPVPQDEFHISGSFAIRPLIKAANRTANYYILALSSGGVHLFEALNEHIEKEVKNDDFPFKSNPHYITHSDKASDPKQLDNMTREFFNKVDKAVVRVINLKEMPVVVISTDSNFDFLGQVADKPKIYVGHTPINYNEVTPHKFGADAWEVIKQIQHGNRTAAIDELKHAVSQGLVVTDLQEIYQAALDGKGELLVVNQDTSIPVVMTSERTFNLTDIVDGPNLDKDVISSISWNVMSQRGKVVYTNQEELKELGKIALKLRY